MDYSVGSVARSNRIGLLGQLLSTPKYLFTVIIILAVVIILTVVATGEGSAANFLTANSNAIGLGASVLGLGFAFYTRSWILRQDAGSDKMSKIAAAIQKGARAFLMTEYRYISILVAIVVVVLLEENNTRLAQRIGQELIIDAMNP